jgi:hypothetical protein
MSKQAKSQESFKLKGIISRGEHLSIEERRKIAKEVIGGLKRLGFTEEHFNQFFPNDDKESNSPR